MKRATSLLHASLGLLCGCTAPVTSPAPSLDETVDAADAAVLEPIDPAGPTPDESTPDDAEGLPRWEAEPVDGPAPEVEAVGCAPVPEPEPADRCPYPLEVVVWASHAWSPMAAAFAEDESPCGQYWVSVPPIVGDKTRLRATAAAELRGRSPRVHAMAELHWHAWNAYRRDTGASWRQIGQEFRQRMVDAGYCVESGDTWVINEVPSGVRVDPAVRAGFAELVLGLYDGTPGMPTARGAVLVYNFGHATRNLSVYKPSVKSWLTDRAFWERMNRTVRFWGQEAYVDPRFTCVPGSSLSARADRIAEFAMHPARLAAAAPDSARANAAEIYFGRAYVPILNGVWHSAPTNGYGDTRLPASEMADFLSEQVYATRRWADGHAYPDGRIGFAFASRRDPPEWTRHAAQIARAVRNAYGRGNGPLAACYEDGRRAHCTCSMAGAAFNPTWAALGTW